MLGDKIILFQGCCLGCQMLFFLKYIYKILKKYVGHVEVAGRKKLEFEKEKVKPLKSPGPA